MNKDLYTPNIGGNAVYNGHIPMHINEYDKMFIRGRLISGKRYKVIGYKFSINTGAWYRVKDDIYDVWVPIDSLDINIKDKYDLR